MSHNHTRVHKNVTPYQPGRGIKIKEKVKSALETAVGASQAGCCPRCADQVQWKQKYCKFKMLKQPTKCNGCLKLLVKAAYHKLCRGARRVSALRCAARAHSRRLSRRRLADCARAKRVCPKCQVAPAPAPTTSSADAAAVAALTEAMAGMRERERRAARRALEQGLPLPPHLPRRQDGSDDDDEEEEAEEAEEEEEEREEGGGEGREQKVGSEDESDGEEEDES